MSEFHQMLIDELVPSRKLWSVNWLFFDLGSSILSRKEMKKIRSIASHPSRSVVQEFELTIGGGGEGETLASCNSPGEKTDLFIFPFFFCFLECFLNSDMIAFPYESQIPRMDI